MILPDSPRQSREVQVRVTICIDIWNVNSNVLVVDDCYLRLPYSASCYSNDPDQTIGNPYRRCDPDVQRIAFIVLREQVINVIEGPAEYTNADTDM